MNKSSDMWFWAGQNQADSFMFFFLFFGGSGGRSQIIVWKGERLLFIGQFLERVVSLWRRGGYDGMYFLLDLDEKMSMKGSRRYFRMALCTDRVQVDAFP